MPEYKSAQSSTSVSSNIQDKVAPLDRQYLLLKIQTKRHYKLNIKN